MVNNKKQSSVSSDASLRRPRRGRPAGSNRVPLSREERRARNAQYERERRDETAALMSQLIEAANCDPNITQADLLATVICRIQEASNSENIEDLERVNANLEAQIASAEERLGLDDDVDILEAETPRKKRKRSEHLSSGKSEKRMKTESGSSADSGVESSTFTCTQPEPSLEFLTDADIALLSDWVSAETSSSHSDSCDDT